MIILGQENLKPENKKEMTSKIVEKVKSENEFKEEKPTLENLIFVLEPNAARYEFHDVDNRILAGFLHHKFNVLLFNYIGFDSPKTGQFSLHVFSKGNQKVN